MTEIVQNLEEPELRRFPPYPTLKASGIPGRGDIPAHWQVQPLKRIGKLQAGAGFPDVEQGVTTEDVPFFKVGDMGVAGNERYLIDPQHTVSREIAQRLRAAVLPPGTVVFAKVGAALMLNRRRLIARPSCMDNNMMGFIGDDCHPVWALYWLSTIDMGELANPGAVPSVNEGQIRSTPTVVPPREEQRTIAEFLDRETGKIDALVAKKEELIKLLQEKRTAFITHAVTKGLDPNAPMKDSGIEWLGEIPAHWGSDRLKWVAKLESGHTPDKKVDAYWVGGDIPWVSLNDTSFLKAHDFIEDTAYHTNAQGLANSSARLLPRGAVVFTRDATIGLCAISTRPMAVSQHIIAWIPGARLLPEYLLRVFDAMQHELMKLTMGATIRTIGMTDVKRLAGPVPPIEEQEAILCRLRQETFSADQLIAKVREAMDRLHELRTALISAAVTGKIDVRKEVK